MPIIEVTLWDLERLVRKELDISYLEDLLPRIKCEIEDIQDENISFEATHDRPDLYSAEGVARALRGLMEIEEGLPHYRSRGVVSRSLNEGPEYRPYVMLATVYGVSLDDEAIRQLMQLQEKLHLTYGRNRRKVSIGLYDLKGINLPVKYVAADPDETRMVPLDMESEMSLREVLEKHPKGREYAHLVSGYPKYPLIIDSNSKVVSFPPIVNSEEFRVTEQSRDILIDVTATDLNAAEKVITIVATAVAERGGEIGQIEIVNPWGTYVSPRLDPGEIDLDVPLIKRLVGIELKVEDIGKLLRRMRLDFKEIADNRLKVYYPFYRTDILHQVDIVEDIVMAYGYENIEPEVLPPFHPGGEDGLEIFTRSIRESMVGLGFLEVNNYMMTNKALLYKLMCVEEKPTVEVENPRHEAYHCLRTWILPQLMQVLSRSKHADYPQKIFEVGDVVLLDEKQENRVREERHLAYAIAGRNVTLTNGLATLKAFLNDYNFSYNLKPMVHGSFIPGRVAEIYISSRRIGLIGEIHPRVLENFELKVPVTAAEINLGLLRELYLKVHT